VSANLIPGADPERLFELEKTGETDELKALAKRALEEADITREYDIGYRNNSQKTGEHKGTYYSPQEVSPYYNGSESVIHVPIESNIHEFYASLDGEFRLVDNNGEDRTYKLVMSCDEGMVLKGEVGFGERDITDFSYTREDKDPNRLQIYLDGNWCNFGRATEIGEGNETMNHIEIIESAYKQLTDARPADDQNWQIVYSSNLEEELEELPPYIESTMDNKTTAFEQNLGLGLEPEKMLSAMSPPWKPLLEMKLGSDHRAMFITSSNLSQEDMPEGLQGDRELIGLSAGAKTDFKQKFGSNSGGSLRGESGKGKTSGLNYAINLL